MDDYEQQAYEEGRYWFCLTDVVDYMEIHGRDKVFSDLDSLFEQRQQINTTRSEIAKDSPF
jgi:prophage antirepressor-like protein